MNEKIRLRVTVTLDYDGDPKNYSDNGNTTPEQMAAIDQGNWERDPSCLLEMITLRDDISIRVTPIVGVAPRTGKYANLDAGILAAIREGNGEFTDLYRVVVTQCRALADVENAGNSDPDRILDRRLQALRKDKKIRYARGGRAAGGGWVLA